VNNELCAIRSKSDFPHWNERYKIRQIKNKESLFLIFVHSDISVYYNNGYIIRVFFSISRCLNRPLRESPFLHDHILYCSYSDLFSWRKSVHLFSRYCYYRWELTRTDRCEGVISPITAMSRCWKEFVQIALIQQLDSVINLLLKLFGRPSKSGLVLVHLHTHQSQGKIHPFK